MATLERNLPPAPTLSLYELVELFDDHPTPGLVVAICEQTHPRPCSSKDLLWSMYAVPRHMRTLPHWFEGRISDEQASLIDEGFLVWWRATHP